MMEIIRDELLRETAANQLLIIHVVIPLLFYEFPVRPSHCNVGSAFRLPF